VVDVDFDFGRAAEDRARRRTAERLGRPGDVDLPARGDDGADPDPGAVPASDSGNVLLADSPGAAGALAPPAGAAGAPRGRRLGAARRRAIADPDRIALWAVLLGIFLVALAAASSRADAAEPAAPAPAALERTVPVAPGVAPASVPLARIAS
jgi:hypothetical protein